MLCVGVWLHAASSMLAAITLPSAVREFGGGELIGWAFALYLLGSILAGAGTGVLARLTQLKFGPVSAGGRLCGYPHRRRGFTGPIRSRSAPPLVGIRTRCGQRGQPDVSEKSDESRDPSGSGTVVRARELVLDNVVAGVRVNTAGNHP